MENNNLQSVRNNVKPWHPAIMTPMAGQLTSTVTRVTQEFLVEINNVDVKIAEYLKMARKDPVVRSCIELKCLRAALMLGRYRHKDAFIQKWVQSNFDTIEGSLAHKVGRMAAAMALGFSASEIVFSNTNRGSLGEWRLTNLNILDQTRISFEGKKGKVENLLYQESDGDKLAIPYKKIIHIVNGYSANMGEFDAVYGDAESGTAYQYYKAKQAILTEMMVAAKNNASGIWIGKADSNETVQVVDSRGNPIYNSDGSPKTEPAALSLLKQLLNIESNSVLVTDIKNQVQPMSVDSKEGFWQITLNILDAAIMRAYSVPELVFKEGSGNFGINGIGKQHVLLMDAQIESIVVQIRDQLIEKVVKPLLIWNFGVTDDYGTFGLDPVEDPEAKNLLVNNIITATGSQLLQPTDLNVQNKVRELLGIPTITPAEQFELSQQKLLQDYFSNQIYATGLPPIMYRQPALEDQAKTEEKKQELGLQNEFDAREQEQQAIEAEAQQVEESQPKTEDGKPAADGDNGNAGTTPEEIEKSRKRMNPQNATKKKVKRLGS
jgi:hypothetical protein